MDATIDIRPFRTGVVPDPSNAHKSLLARHVSQPGSGPGFRVITGLDEACRWFGVNSEGAVQISSQDAAHNWEKRSISTEAVSATISNRYLQRQWVTCHTPDLRRRIYGERAHVIRWAYFSHDIVC